MVKIPEKWPSKFPYAPWYLDVVANDWRFVKSINNDGDIDGILPFQLEKRWGLKLLTPPPLCPRLGPLLFYKEGMNQQEKQIFESKVLLDLEQQLPKCHHAKINWPYELTQSLSWEKAGWEQKKRYSYVLDLSESLDTIWRGFKPSVRNKIRKAQKHLKIVTSQDWQVPFLLTQKVFEHRKVKEQLSFSFMSGLDNAAQIHKSRVVFIASDKLGQNHAAMWLFFDENAAYNLLLGSDPELRSSGAAPFLIWHAIQFSKEQGLTIFDFEGSQLPGVEAFFRSFGGEAKNYYQLTKTVGWLKTLKLVI